MNLQSLRARYQMFVGLSWVAAVFCVIIVSSLLVSFARRVPDPLSDAHYLQLKSSLQNNPGDEAIQLQLRAWDAELRSDYFRRREWARWGSFLLLGGVVACIASAKACATIRRQLPQPSQRPIAIEDPDARLSLQSLSAVGGLAAGVFLVGAVMAITDQSVVPSDEAELAALFPPPTPAVIEDSGSNSSAVAAIIKPLPTQNQIAEQWHRFRGPGSAGISPFEFDLTSWDGSSGEGILWKTPIPLPGNNSPIRWSDRIFLSAATAESQEVDCFDAQTGDLLWQTSIPPSDPQAAPPDVNEDTGFAAPTMTTDGSRVFAMFAGGLVVALDWDGREVWRRDLGVPQNSYGHASSLLVDRDRLIIQFDQGSTDDDLSKLIALSSDSGELVWQTSRSTRASWSSPLLLEHEGEMQVITCADPWVIAYAADDGSERWRCKALRQDVGPSPIAGDGVVFVANEFPGATAIRLGGSGDVTDSHVVWTAEFSIPDTASPLLFDDLILMMTSFGTLACYDAKVGDQPLWEEDFDDNFQSSPTRIGDSVLLIGQSGKCWLIHPTRDQCETIGESDLGEECVSCPALGPQRIYIRGRQHLICIGAP